MTNATETDLNALQRGVIAAVERAAAERGGLTGEQIALELGITKAHWSLLRSGKRRPSADLFRRIARVFPSARQAVIGYALGSDEQAAA